MFPFLLDVKGKERRQRRSSGETPSTENCVGARMPRRVRTRLRMSEVSSSSCDGMVVPVDEKKQRMSKV